MELIEKYFPKLSEKQKIQFQKLGSLYRDWNEKINVISRKDIDNLYTHHILHSLAIAMTVHFRPETEVLDFGTGGGFPGIPLAIVFPDSHFRLIDGTGKKIRVASAIAESIGLENCTAVHQRGEDEHGHFDFVVSRAVMPLSDLTRIVRKNIKKKSFNAIENGVICLKGGNITDEIKPFKRIADVTPIFPMIDNDWFQEKYVVHIPL